MSAVGPERWLQLAAIGTWIAAAAPAVAAMLTGRLTGWSVVVWVAASLAFLAAFGAMHWTAAMRGRRAVSVGLLVLQSASALAMVSVGEEGLPAGVLLVVVAGQLLALVDPWSAGVWIAAQTAALLVFFWRIMSPVSALTYGAAYGGFQLFALATAALAQRERRAREALDVANTELQATRALMAEHSRVAERLRIARDLHDTLGHHLTALSLQLDVASRLTSGKAADHVTEAHALVRLLLADVRDVVGQLREGSRFDLLRAVRTLAELPAGSLAIHLDAPDEMPIAHDEQAHALLRCVQEIVTNTMRHAQARHLWLTFQSGPDGIVVHGRDDGRGAGSPSWGHGLTGMRERFEALDGRLDVSTRVGGGFEVHGFIPHRQEAS
jgi:signal transduction histidine kinase